MKWNNFSKGILAAEGDNEIGYFVDVDLEFTDTIKNKTHFPLN